MARVTKRKQQKQKSPESGETVARKVWLAGLGAYGKSVEDAHDQIDKASHEASKLFQELVNKGQSIEEESREALKERISEAKGRISEARERVSEVAGSGTRSVEEMISRVRERMGFDDPVHARLDALARQVNALARKVTGLSLRNVRPEAGTDTAAREPAAAAPRKRAAAGAGAAPRRARKAPAKPARRGRPAKGSR